jgi:hypothetical protein
MLLQELEHGRIEVRRRRQVGGRAGTLGGTAGAQEEREEEDGAHAGRRL